MKLFLCLLVLASLTSCSSGGSIKRVANEITTCDAAGQCSVNRIERGDR